MAAVAEFKHTKFFSIMKHIPKLSSPTSLYEGASGYPTTNKGLRHEPRGLQPPSYLGVKGEFSFFSNPVLIILVF